MKRLPMLLWLACGSAAVAAVPGPAARPACPSETAEFPSYRSIEGNVSFWKRVFGEWSTTRVVVHDIDHPAVVYEVADLPGPAAEQYSAEQREFVERLDERWRQSLRGLSRKVTDGTTLDEEEKRVALVVATGAGTDALTGAADRVRTQRGMRERFRRGLELAQRYDAAIRRILRERGLPEELVFLPHVESSYRTDARSTAGAVGAWQFTRGAGRRFLRVGPALDERLDPILAAYGAADYLADAHRQLGDWALALTAYNHGVNGMARAVALHGGDYQQVLRHYSGRSFGFASKNFYAEFLAAGEIACDPVRYFPEGLSPESPLDHERVALGERTTAERIAESYGVPLDRLAAINPAWTPRAIESRAPLPAGSSVWLPAGSLADLARRGIGIEAAWERVPEDDGVYVVRSGDTLTSIARRHGMTVDRLRAVNGMTNAQSVIHAGQRLRLSAGDEVLDAVVHVVRSGETLLRIATIYGVRLGDLLALNGLTVDSVIHPGQRIRLPLGL
ncbi:MAG TPA: LysM peptidoglycan-binding domain-containing protein [Candidatus Polarisedimenticolaceae bacterium]|nr:LysM peptidoglycan-binding domain-containing protein [Candidatus Polarisedimenticolaceae bacterium]